MILSQHELEQISSVEPFAGNAIPLQPARIENYKGNLRITNKGSNRDVTTDVEVISGQWRLSAGSYYVTFDWTGIDLEEDHTAFILPAPNALRVGTHVVPAMVFSSDLSTILRVEKSVRIDLDATLGLLVIHRNGGVTEEDVKTIVSNTFDTKLPRFEGEEITKEAGR